MDKAWNSVVSFENLLGSQYYVLGLIACFIFLQFRFVSLSMDDRPLSMESGTDFQS